MGLFHSCFKLQMSKSQTNHVAFKSASSSETCISHYSSPQARQRETETEADWSGHIPSTKGLRG